MNILHISYYYPPPSFISDGISYVIKEQTKELVKRNHKVTVCTSNFIDYKKRKTIKPGNYILNGVNVYYFKTILNYKTFLITPSLILYLLNNISSFDIVHIHDVRSFPAIITYYLCKINKIPYIYQPHGSYLPKQNKSIIEKFFISILDTIISDNLIKEASKIIILNDSEKKRYLNYGISKEKIISLPNGIDTNLYIKLPPKNSFKKRYNISSNTKIILYLGRINETKNIELLIKSYKKLRDNNRNKNLLLVIAGPDDGYLNKLQKLIMELKLNNSIKIMGFINNAEKIEVMIAAEAFITPSFYGLPITFLESCVVGTPIITTNKGDFLDWIDNNVGYVTDANEYALMNAINNIIFNTSLRDKYSENCIKLIKSEYSWTIIINKLIHIYHEVIMSKIKKMNDTNV